MAAFKTERTPEKDERFFEALAKTGIVIDACAACGYGRTAVYERRKSDTEFAKRWDDAIEAAIQAMEREADRRGRDGFEEPLFHAGKPVMVKGADGVERQATTRRHSDTLLIFRLKALRPEMYRERVDMQGEVNVTFGLADRLDAARRRLQGEKPKGK